MKEFRVAHIVPVSHLSDTVDNQYHMCLAHLVKESDEYAAHFARVAAGGKFVLMDNGAAEGAQLRPEALFEMYEEVGPTEIVLPDTLFEPASTIQKSRAFLQMMQDRGAGYRTMAVPQGRTLAEWAACARIFVKDTRINAIGISKFLNVATRDRYVRFKACGILDDLIREYNRTDDLEVHLLGCDEGPLIVKMCHEAYPFVRGCDSAFAYLQAQAGKRMTLRDDGRPDGTIDFLGGWHLPMFGNYERNFNEFAGVKNNGVDSSWGSTKAMGLTKATTEVVDRY